MPSPLSPVRDITSPTASATAPATERHAPDTVGSPCTTATETARGEAMAVGDGSDSVDICEVVTGPDGVVRPVWADRTEAARAYFDNEWGRTIDTERGLYELVVLLVFAGGLSWASVLGRRDALREAFAEFDPDAVATFTDCHVQDLVDDVRIIRNRRKIAAAVTNARATCALRSSGGLAGLVRRQPDDETDSAAVDLTALPRSGERARRLADDLATAGFVRLGPVASQALLLASGAIPVRRPAAG